MVGLDLRDREKKFKDGRHVGLDFYDLLPRKSPSKILLYAILSRGSSVTFCPRDSNRLTKYRLSPSALSRSK